MPPSPKQQQDGQAQRRLAVLRLAEEVTGNVSLTCRYYGISRSCFYKWQRRYQDEGIEGLRDRSARRTTARTPLRQRSSTRSSTCGGGTTSAR
ncbi:helix-turn-helix domain-containing protein [Streptomyces sp. NPDC001436]